MVFIYMKLTPFKIKLKLVVSEWMTFVLSLSHQSIYKISDGASCIPPIRSAWDKTGDQGAELVGD